MSDKSKICQSCGRWKENGVPIYEDSVVWWTCRDCLLKEVGLFETTIKDMRLAADTPIWVDVNDTTLLAPYPSTTIPTT